MYKIGMTVKVLQMIGEPHYTGKIGIIEHIDAIGQLHGTWGGLAIQPERDNVLILSEPTQERTEAKR